MRVDHDRLLPAESFDRSRNLVDRSIRDHPRVLLVRVDAIERPPFDSEGLNFGHEFGWLSGRCLLLGGKNWQKKFLCMRPRAVGAPHKPEDLIPLWLRRAFA